MYERCQSPNRDGPVPLEQMDWQPTRSNQGGTEQKRAKWVPEKEIQRWRANRLCICCGAGGHYIQKCPYLPANRPLPIRSARATAAQAPPPPSLEDEPTSKSDSEKE
ncbi:uncharacterized protein EI97DRAFT_167555 [Westerdykella ornata]|uniref:CCHC-type domain-containing protein n=1 Tax=Westerdykella ornata TaxID=318751 RepID=A0A6A6JSF0_WESOR|nr:uncharacterized protein EI97DRAFT_167555 [Westerdykella ornata]KAF2279185.1 hypothetical protein EI97DRAFT_167555 [Westerdykella ornata]